MQCQRVLVRCGCAQPHCFRSLSRPLSAAASGNESRSSKGTAKQKDTGTQQNGGGEEEEGAMSRRLREMADEACLEGGKSARKNIKEAGFSEELKAKLEERLAASSFKNEHAGAISLANMPAGTSKHSRDIAASAPWTGTESFYDASLRMLNDVSKPMRVPFKPPTPGLSPRAKFTRSSGQRLASARDRTSEYSRSQDMGLSDKEREQIRNELRDRFAPGARALPATLEGLSALANERIEEAIATGQFRNIPRGKGKHVERDHKADSPYVDTTEYFMNRILQKQKATPEWIQKQQDMRLEVDRFRSRLRADWRRHAAMLIASQGGSLESQITRARAYAAAEERLVIAAKDRKALEDSNNNDINNGKEGTGILLDDGEFRTQIDLEGKITPLPSSRNAADTDADNSSGSSGATKAVSSQNQSSLAEPGRQPESEPEPLPILSPLRDPQYLSIEREYHALAIKKLNDQIRSYNLQAPQVSQRPYLTLERELENCYVEVAPSLPEEVKRRATEKARVDHNAQGGKSNNGRLQQILGLGQGEVKVYGEDATMGYGFKQFWRDLWHKDARIS